MLKKVRVLVLAAFFFALAPQASAEQNGSCELTDVDHAVCVSKASTVATPASHVEEKPSKVQCFWGDLSIPCTTEAGWWYPRYGCYVKPVAPQPSKDEPIWNQHTDGVIMWCDDRLLDVAVGVRSQIWMPSAESHRDPEAVARDVVASMGLEAIRIGMVPLPLESSPQAMGIVGQNMWLWADAPDEKTWGPITKTATADGVSVSVNAKVKKVLWDMGNTDVVTCRGPGEVWKKWKITEPNMKSPSCGYVYNKQGRYVVKAKSLWEIGWSGGGSSGVITLELS